MLQRAQVLNLWLAFYLYLFGLRVFGVQPFRGDTCIGATVSDGELVAVTVAAGDGDLRDLLTACRHAGTGFNKHQHAGFYRHLGAVALRKPGQEFSVALLRLVDMRNRDARQLGRYPGLKFVAGGDGFHHGAERGVVVGLLPARVKRAAKIRAARPDGQGVRRAPVFNFIDGKIALPDKRLALPAHEQRQHRSPDRQLKLTVGVVELNIELVSLKATVIGQRQAQKPLTDNRRDIFRVNPQHKSRRHTCACTVVKIGQHQKNPPATVFTFCRVSPALPTNSCAC
ncbi:hypothetical protein BN130_2156 [Cronobacter malonaticus 507]|nr:hypothetical protein BN130_2156 [Cronobacter malonaticus 507]